MNNRDRLVELLDVIIQPGEKTLGEIADHLTANGVTVPVRCKDCVHFMEYTDESAKIFKANGDCLISKMNSYDEEFSRCKYDDYCSYGVRKENGDE